MKNKKLYYALMIIPVIIAIICLFFLPDQIPVHYGAGGMVDRYGSKYETFLFPFLIIVFGLFGLFMISRANKTEENNNFNNAKIMYYANLGSLLLFNGLFLYFLYTSFNNVQSLNSVDLPIDKIVRVAIGILLIVIGNMMPKTKRNSIIGLRTKWSMKNDVVWKKSQKFGGISFIISGCIIILSNILIPNFMNGLFIMIIVLVIDSLISLYYTYYIAKKEENS